MNFEVGILANGTSDDDAPSVLFASKLNAGFTVSIATRERTGYFYSQRDGYVDMDPERLTSPPPVLKSGSNVQLQTTVDKDTMKVQLAVDGAFVLREPVTITSKEAAAANSNSKPAIASEHFARARVTLFTRSEQVIF
eukprot:tig00000455_g1027.t1